MNLNGVEYYYIRNAQGDIIGLFNKNGNIIATYIYDSWGQVVSIKDGSGNNITTDTTTVGYKNPYRYRGYRYDNETGLYYLQSRYYNPEWGRFINADGIVGQTGELLAHNLFVYSKNNPINMSDPNGFRPAFDNEETQEKYEDWVWKQNQAHVNSSSAKSNNTFDYKASAIKGTKSGAVDSVCGYGAAKAIKEKLVYRKSGTLALGEYTSNFSKFAKGSKQAIGLAGTIGFTAWDVGTSLASGEYVGAGIDILSGIAGVGAGVLVGLGATALVSAGAPELLMGAIGFGACVGTGMVIDKISSVAKDEYYGR